MRVPIVVPVIGDAVPVVRIRRWLKQVGEAVACDEPLVEITTDKIDLVLPSPATGVLSSSSAGAEAVVPVGTEIGWVEES